MNYPEEVRVSLGEPAVPCTTRKWVTYFHPTVLSNAKKILKHSKFGAVTFQEYIYCIKTFHHPGVGVLHERKEILTSSVSNIL